MKLITKAQMTKLTKNGESDAEDFQPVVKLFNPVGAATWLISEIDGDIMFGLCDLGMGSPELGYVSLTELSEFRGSFGLGIERDQSFTANRLISEYADEARTQGRITA